MQVGVVLGYTGSAARGASHVAFCCGSGGRAAEKEASDWGWLHLHCDADRVGHAQAEKRLGRLRLALQERRQGSLPSPTLHRGAPQTALKGSCLWQVASDRDYTWSGIPEKFSEPPVWYQRGPWKGKGRFIKEVRSHP